MNATQSDLRGVYEALSTDALLELHAAGTLTEDAYVVLESVLRSRSVPVPQRPNPEHQRREIGRGRVWAGRFAIIGIVLPVVCLVLGFEPKSLMRVCEVGWPTGFMLLASEGRFDPAIVFISIASNAAVWAGFGWLIGYGLSRRTRRE